MVLWFCDCFVLMMSVRSRLDGTFCEMRGVVATSLWCKFFDVEFMVL